VELRVSWDRPFDQPVPLPSGPSARTLRDAANYIKTLTSSERDTAEWRLAIQMLIFSSVLGNPSATRDQVATAMEMAVITDALVPDHPDRSG
jgi:hypothetical protein